VEATGLMPRPKASAAARGYDHRHQRERERWRPKVEAGLADCAALRCVMPTRAILPGQAWDLGHDEARTRWTGPEHAPCNRADGGRRGAAVTNGQRFALRHSRSW
jgi:hypothetical protein